MTAQVTDVVGVEALPGGSSAALSVEDAGDDGVGVVGSQTMHQLDGVVVSPYGGDSVDG